MKFSFLHIAVRSLKHDHKNVFYQVIIIALLTGVITGALMTGSSVRDSLKNTSLTKLGNTGIVISSGMRYFNPSLAAKVESITGLESTGLLEIDGYCQNFTAGTTSPAIKIFAVDDDFFSFHGNDNIRLANGEVAINQKLSAYLNLNPGDELIIKFGVLSDLPADAPFSPDKSNTTSFVIRTGMILSSSESGDFSLGISQITPLNVFMSLSDLKNRIDEFPGVNRLLLENKPGVTVAGIYHDLEQTIGYDDIGLSIREIPRTGGFEIISDRVFIDELVAGEIEKLSLESYPAITYLANSIDLNDKSTPYSFISALDPNFYPGLPPGNGIILNRWLADDLQASTGDTVAVKYFTVDSGNHLVESEHDFVVFDIVDMSGIWSDSLLMPEFPGITGKESCSNWDAGISINLNLIRKKDENYWDRYGGTPKAFINYEKGKELWESNYGSLTAIRFGEDVTESQISEQLKGAFDPYKTGFSISNLPQLSTEAARNSVDFSSLFLGLGFFLILSAILLLILVVSNFLESKSKSMTTMFSIGFKNRDIMKILAIETVIISMAGVFPGILLGSLFNILTIKALNSVWQGAVQTNTLSAGFNSLMLLSGLFFSIILVLAILAIKSTRFLKKLNSTVKVSLREPSPGRNLAMSVILVLITILLVVFSFIFSGNATVLSFLGGVSCFAALIFIIRHAYLKKADMSTYNFSNIHLVSDRYYFFNSYQAIAPVLFLAAGLFAVIITGVNRLDLNESMLQNSGGTGGFLLWGESSLPLKGDLNSAELKREHGLDDAGFEELFFVQASKTSGNDASCLNLNHITSPPLIGLDPEAFIERGSFSFATRLKGLGKTNPWLTLNTPPNDSTIYGVVDQTVLQYGLKIKTGDTLKIRAENGQVLNVVISGGLKSSVFQGYVLTGNTDFHRFFPSVSGSQIFLADGNHSMEETYQEILNDRLSEFGIHFEKASERLASFFVVTNTYLTVFTFLGGIGMALGVAGLGFVLLRNVSQRSSEFGLMMATGFPLRKIRSMIFRDHLKILAGGLVTGIASAFLATRPSIAGNESIPWSSFLVLTVLILLTGLAALTLSVRSIQKDVLVRKIRKE